MSAALWACGGLLVGLLWGHSSAAALWRGRVRMAAQGYPLVMPGGDSYLVRRL